MRRGRIWLRNLVDQPVWAVRGHRIAHRLWVTHHHFAARFVRVWTQVLTGADIHPAARIGRPFSLGHTVGVVIGEDVHIGSGCTLMQGVTLGQLTLDAHLSAGRFQPTLGDGVLVGANAVLLGPIAIGDGAVIGAGAVVLCDVPARHRAVGNPARLLPPKGDAPPAER